MSVSLGPAAKLLPPTATAFSPPAEALEPIATPREPSTTCASSLPSRVPSTCTSGSGSAPPGGGSGMSIWLMALSSAASASPTLLRSEGRRVGEACVGTWYYWCATLHYKKNKIKNKQMTQTTSQ